MADRHILKSLANHLSFMFHCIKPLFLGKFISLFWLSEVLHIAPKSPNVSYAVVERK